jgi:hypothetical protein
LIEVERDLNHIHGLTERFFLLTILLFIANGYRYRLDEIDEFLAEIDGHVDYGVCSGRGPFSVFPAAERPFCSSQSSNNECVDNNTLTALQASGTPSEEYNYDLEAESQNPAMHCSVEQTTEEATKHDNNETNFPFSEFSPDLPEEAISLDPECYNIPSTLDAIGLSNLGGSSSTLESDSSPKPTTPQSRGEIFLSINEIHAPIFGSKIIDRLLSHYMINIADLLLPILHEKNPWRNLYMPTIFDAAAVHYFAPDQAHGRANSALYYAALSTASFHIWYGQRDKNELHRMGTLYRCKAMQSLQLAVTSTNAGTQYRDLLMAMLSLVTNGV